MNPVDDQLRDRRRVRGDHRQALGERLDHGVGQAVAVAVRGDLGGQEEEVARPVQGADRRLAERPGPGDPVREAEGLGAGAQSGLEGPIAHHGEPDR